MFGADETTLVNKSLEEVAEDLRNESNAPTIDSYGGHQVFVRYKKNKWFENVNINALMRLKGE